MLGSDIVTVSLGSDGEFIADDRYVPWAPYSYEQEGVQGLYAYEDDCSNDWTVISGDETDGVVTVLVARLLNTGDAQDRVVYKFILYFIV